MRGHVYKRGNTYTYVVDLGRDQNGKRMQTSKGGFDLKKKAEAAMNQLIVKVEKGDYFVSKDMFYKDYLEKWMLEYCVTNLEPKTVKTYKQLIDSYIIPKLGNLKLDKLRPLDLQSLYTYMQTVLGLSGTTALRCHEVINVSLKHAVQWQMINNNVALSVQRPRKNKPEMNVLDAEQSNMLIERTSNLTLYLPILLALTTGMRRGEILGLTWDNVNLDEGVIYVKRQLKTDKGILKFGTLKTTKSKRKIVLLDYTIPILAAEKKRQAELSSEICPQHKKWNLVICQSDFSPYQPDYVSRNFLRKMTKISIELNLPKIRFHDLRHTHATLLLLGGINPKIVSERLGHSSIGITLDTYSHVLPCMQEEAATKLNMLMLNSNNTST